MKTTMSIDKLRDILIASAGEDDALGGDISDVSFDELGYDSLALIETAAILRRDYGVLVPDDELTGLRGPGELLSLINDRLAA